MCQPEQWIYALRYASRSTRASCFRRYGASSTRGPPREDYEFWLQRSIEESFERLVVDRNVQGPERLLLRQIRHCFPMGALPGVVVVVNETVGATVEFLESPECQELLNGRCLASTRDGGGMSATAGHR